MRPGKVDAATVGDALVSTFRSAGYAGSSLRNLAAATGLKSASLYHRFARGKADMALAALARVGEGFGDLVIAPLASDAPPIARLKASAAGTTRFYDQGTLACLLAVLATSDAPDEVRGAVRAAFESWRVALGATLSEAGCADPLAEAEDRIAAVQGALILARAGGGCGAFARAVERLGREP